MMSDIKIKMARNNIHDEVNDLIKHIIELDELNDELEEKNKKLEDTVKEQTYIIVDLREDIEERDAEIKRLNSDKEYAEGELSKYRNSEWR